MFTITHCFEGRVVATEQLQSVDGGRVLSTVTSESFAGPKVTDSATLALALMNSAALWTILNMKAGGRLRSTLARDGAILVKNATSIEPIEARLISASWPW